MTLRTFFMLTGLFMLVPQVWFWFIFQPGRPLVPHRPITRDWWLTTSLRLLSATVFLGGFRVFVNNAVKLDQPAQFAGWFDQVTSISTLSVGAAASVVFLAVFLRYRDWDSK